MESEIRFPSFSTLVTLTVTSWPTVRTSLACATRRREISVTWTRPSTPPRSTNAPKSVIERTLARQDRAERRSSRGSRRGSSSMASRRRAARLTTTRRPSSAYSMTRKSNDWPTNSRRPGSSWRPTSIWETGQNARRPAGPADGHLEASLVAGKDLAEDRDPGLPGGTQLRLRAARAGELLREPDVGPGLDDHGVDPVADLLSIQLVEVHQRLGLGPDRDEDDVRRDAGDYPADGFPFLGPLAGGESRLEGGFECVTIRRLGGVDGGNGNGVCGHGRNSCPRDWDRRAVRRSAGTRIVPPPATGQPESVGTPPTAPKLRTHREVFLV